MSPDNAEGTGVGAGPKAARELLIDRQLPRFDAYSFSALIVDADTEQAYRAVRALDPEQVAVSVPFMRLMGQARACQRGLLHAAVMKGRRRRTPCPPSRPGKRSCRSMRNLGWSSSWA